MEINSLYVIKRDSGLCMYHKDFQEEVFDPQLLSSFVIAMTTFFDEVTRSSKPQARAFEGADYTLIVEFGEWTVGAVSADKESQRLREKLKAIIAKFENQFSLLRWVDLDLAVYTRFERHVIEAFIRDRIDPDSQIIVKPHWEFYTKNPDVVSFLRLVPQICTVKDAADFWEIPLEIALNLTAEALWEKAITVKAAIRSDDIYEATALTGSRGSTEVVPPEVTRVLSQLDGETPLTIAAERVKTADLKRFLGDIAVLAEKHEVELVSPAQAVVVLFSSALQELMDRCAKIMGRRVAHQIFFDSREKQAQVYPWLAFVDFDESLDVEVKSSLMSAAGKRRITPEILNDGFRNFLHSIVRNTRSYMGAKPANIILEKTQEEMGKQFPRRYLDIEWELLNV
ncbi:MAG: hypothetical protein GQ580_02045 [Candidatus Thorarchaeota archaeon]|nr:hypothetical protein [Candidatus Thorarchaeota archaeon]